MFTSVVVVVVRIAGPLEVVVVLALREPVPDQISDVLTHQDTNVFTSGAMFLVEPVTGIVGLIVAFSHTFSSHSSQLFTPELKRIK